MPSQLRSRPTRWWIQRLLATAAWIAAGPGCTESSESSPSPPPSPTTCPAGFFGPSCLPCNCADGGLCHDGVDGTGVCTCPRGTFGPGCTQRCACANGAACSDGANGDGTCTCVSGTYGVDCAGRCECPRGQVCDDGRDGTGACTNLTPAANDIQLRFDRVDTVGLSPIRCIVTLTGPDGPVVGASLVTRASRGSVGPVDEVGAGEYAFVLEPSQSGEHAVEVSYEDLSVSRTAVVLPIVDAAWGQPMAVPGLVNTEAYEDGATATPDGQYLFVQTGPFRFSGLQIYEMPREAGGCGGDRLQPSPCKHEWIDTVMGPYVAPQRPDFFDGRIAGERFLHNSNLWGWGVDEAPFFAPPNMFYGFRRQPDGTYSEPFHVAFADQRDAVMSPWGLSFALNKDGSATTLFSLDDPSLAESVDVDGDGRYDARSMADVYAIEIKLGANTNLGTFEPGNPPTHGAEFPSQRVSFDDKGTEGLYGNQGNPHLLRLDETSTNSIWTDDESGTQDISVYVLVDGIFPGGIWQKVQLPPAINTPGVESQPFFDAGGLQRGGLYYKGDDAILYAAYRGPYDASGYAADASWETPVPILGVRPGAADLDSVAAVGEPTLAVIDGVPHLFFVYARIRGFDGATGVADLDMQAGFVQLRTGSP